MSGPSRLRAVWRLQTFAIGSWLVVASALRGVLSPFPQRWRRTAPFVSRWARLGAWGLGVRVRRSGELPPPGSLVVANHIGYVDVVTIGGLFPCVFAARHDMRSWPMFGALAASGGTIFINRTIKRAGARGVAQVSRALADGATVVAFPEGTSSEGKDLLPFRSGVFQAAVDTGAPVVPAGIRYLALDGEPIGDGNRDVVGWFRNEPFLGHIVRLGGHRRVDAEVAFGEPMGPSYQDRRELARQAEDRVRALAGLAAPRGVSGVGSPEGGSGPG